MNRRRLASGSCRGVRSRTIAIAYASVSGGERETPAADEQRACRRGSETGASTRRSGSASRVGRVRRGARRDTKAGQSRPSRSCPLVATSATTVPPVSDRPADRAQQGSRRRDRDVSRRRQSRCGTTRRAAPDCAYCCAAPMRPLSSGPTKRMGRRSVGRAGRRGYFRIGSSIAASWARGAARSWSTGGSVVRFRATVGALSSAPPDPAPDEAPDGACVVAADGRQLQRVAGHRPGVARGRAVCVAPPAGEAVAVLEDPERDALHGERARPPLTG
jgi:hypothetical protein